MLYLSSVTSAGITLLIHHGLTEHNYIIYAATKRQGFEMAYFVISERTSRFSKTGEATGWTQCLGQNAWTS
jgi:hypothetical protein